MINNIDEIVEKIARERATVRPNDKKLNEIIDDLSVLNKEVREDYEGGEELASRIDELTGTYGAMLSTRAYTQGFRDCLRGIFALLTAVE